MTMRFLLQAAILAPVALGAVIPTSAETQAIQPMATNLETPSSVPTPSAVASEALDNLVVEIDDAEYDELVKSAVSKRDPDASRLHDFKHPKVYGPNRKWPRDAVPEADAKRARIMSWHDFKHPKVYGPNHKWPREALP
ncbi:hypothetical protein CC80DRAFT_531522 [Byssothecium circinans]|uniref:Uncharacterized protein n=1 Tax=Byssothecium circinans TaxID=147558 RepID=A0A6A5UAE1_9PLEO|nr:hypothetical protein CC80DRAFT_531522 [Byssothecium circinans]